MPDIKEGVLTSPAFGVLDSMRSWLETSGATKSSTLPRLGFIIAAENVGFEEFDSCAQGVSEHSVWIILFRLDWSLCPEVVDDTDAS